MSFGRLEGFLFFYIGGGGGWGDFLFLYIVYAIIKCTVTYDILHKE